MIPGLAAREGLVAQRITRLTTDQKIPGSNPGKLGSIFVSCMHNILKKKKEKKKEKKKKEPPAGLEPAIPG